MFVRLAPIAAQNAQNSACAAVRGQPVHAEAQHQHEASGANIAIIASAVGCMHQAPNGVCTSG